MITLTDSMIVQFWRKVDKQGVTHIWPPEPCWEWAGWVDQRGYGHFSVRGKSLLAHRIAYQLTVGPIPYGKELDHLCRVTCCVNPSHLEPVTHKENSLRGVSPPAANAGKAFCPKGHPYSGKNLYIDPSGYRKCRKCIRITSRKANEKKSPTQLSLDYLNKSGYTCAIVEHWNSFAGVRQDCFGFGDILAYKSAPEREADIVLVQTTTANNFDARVKKILASPHWGGWLRAGGRILVHGWGPKGLREAEL